MIAMQILQDYARGGWGRCYEKWKKINAMGADVTHLLANKVNHPNEKMHWIFAWSLFEMILGL